MHTSSILTLSRSFYSATAVTRRARLQPSRHSRVASVRLAFQVILTLVVASSFSPTTAVGSGPAGFRITTKGFGPVRVGMTTAEASAALGVRLVLHEPNEDCRYATPSGGFTGVSFMVISGLVARVDVSSGTYTTPSGAKVGSTEAQVKAIYPGRIKVSQHQYDENGHYLTYMPKDAADRNYRIVFETDGRRVTSIRAGRIPEVEYIEGCS